MPLLGLLASNTIVYRLRCESTHFTDMCVRPSLGYATDKWLFVDSGTVLS